MKNKKEKAPGRRLLSLLLALCVTFTTLPSIAFGQDTEQDEQVKHPEKVLLSQLQDNTLKVTNPPKESQDISYPNTEISKVYGDSKFTNPLTRPAAANSISYSSSDTNVATVNSVTGAVTIVGAGSTTIKATAGRVTASYTLIVAKAPQGDYTFDSKTGTLNIYTEAGTTKWRDSVQPSEVKSVVINSGVTTIQDNAFKECGSITTVSIPNSITSIGDYAFYCCTGITSLTIPDSVTTIGEWAFSGCNGITSVIIPDSVTSIGDYAFAALERLQSVTLSNSITAIGAYEFASCPGLASVTIPQGVTSIGELAFDSCTGLTSVTIPQGVTSIGSYAFQHCRSLKHIDIPDSIISAGDYAFAGCSALISVGIPDSVTAISNCEFMNCTSLKTVRLPDGIESIGAYAFAGCNLMDNVIVPKGVTHIGGAAFGIHGEGMLKITFESLIAPNLSDNIFRGVKYAPKISIPLGEGVSGYTGESANGYWEIYWMYGYIVNVTADYAFNIANGDLTIHTNAGTTAWKEGVTEGDIKTVKIDQGVTNIGKKAFNKCMNVTKVDIPNSVKIIGNRAFSYCGNRSSTGYQIAIPNGVTSIGEATFMCAGVTHITIPDSVTYIGPNAFNASMLTQITIPASVRRLGDAAFGYCARMKSAIFEGLHAPGMGQYMFTGAADDFKITIPVGNAVTGYTGENINYGWKDWQSKIANAPTEQDSRYFKVYGDQNFIIDMPELYDPESYVSVSYESSDTGVATVDSATGEINIKGVGKTVIWAWIHVGGGGEGHAQHTLTVSKAQLTLKADDKSMTAGDPLPEFTYTATGLVNGDTVTEAPTLSATGDGKTAGTYDINISGGTVDHASSYTITYTAGSLTVAPATPQPAPTPKPTPTPGGGGSGGGGGSSSAPSKQEHSNVKVEGDKAVITATTTNAKDGSITVNLPKVVQEEIIREKVNNTAIVVNKPTVSINLNLAAVTTINKQANADVQLTAKVVKDVSSLGSAAKTAVGTRPAYDLKASYASGTKHVTSFGEGEVTIEIPYTLQSGEVASNVCAVYVDDKGKVSYLPSSKYDTKTQTVKFTTNHFSVYGVGYKTHFKDIANHWAKDSIQEVADAGLMSGTGNDMFTPNGAMTRGMFVTTLGRLAGVNAANYSAGKFSDVQADAYYASYVNWAVEKGIVSGTSATTFDPDQSVTRQEMAVMMSNYVKAMGSKLPQTHQAITFVDSSAIASWSKEAVNQMQTAGIISGRDDNSFDPAGTATRGEAATTLCRFVAVLN